MRQTQNSISIIRKASGVFVRVVSLQLVQYCSNADLQHKPAAEISGHGHVRLPTRHIEFNLLEEYNKIVGQQSWGKNNHFTESFLYILSLRGLG